MKTLIRLGLNNLLEAWEQQSPCVNCNGPWSLLKLELVFGKNYAPNICFPKYGRICTVPKSHKKVWTLLKSLTGNLRIMPYQLTKFQTPSSNLTRLKCPLQRAITRENWTKFVMWKVNQVICSSYLISWPTFKLLTQIVLTSLKCQNFPRAITPEIFDGTFSKLNQVIYLSLPISWPSFKLLAQIVFEISCWQD